MTPETKAKLGLNLKKARAQKARNLRAARRAPVALHVQLVARARGLEKQAKALRKAAKLVR